VQGVQTHPQKFWFVGNLGRSLGNLGKIPENLGKIPENLGKIFENAGRNGAQHCLIRKNGAQPLQKNTKTHETLFEVHTKKGLRDLCGRKFVGKCWTETFTKE